MSSQVVLLDLISIPTDGAALALSSIWNLDVTNGVVKGFVACKGCSEYVKLLARVIR